MEGSLITLPNAEMTKRTLHCNPNLSLSFSLSLSLCH